MEIKKGSALKILGRLFRYIGHYYKWELLAVVICIAVTAVAGISSSIFLEILVDDVIAPGLEHGFDYVADTLYTIAGIMAGIYVAGILCSFVYTRLMAVITQGFLKHVREDMFDKMQTLPIRYFDTHTHGDIMSYYTNDVDALRQLISQSVPQGLFSLVSIITLLVTMLISSIYLTLVVLLGVVVMLLVTKSVGGRSAKFFVRQQNSIGKTEGFVEEMINGQKVIKVFCHEEASKRDFAKVNDELYHDADKANSYGNILMPAIMNIGHVVFVAVAIVGGALVLGGVHNLSLTGIAEEVITMGSIVAFLNMSRQFTLNIGQVSMQINAVVMAIAGAGRIFEFLDNEPETDNGYVELVNADIDENGNITESRERTGKWAWRHPHQADGSVTYTELKGDIRLVDVDFGYVPEKLVLHDVTLYAKPGQKIAFVGATGAGKTTITNLINRFYDIEDGKIRYDGININKIKKADLRRSLGIVLQDTNLFTGTIMDNIRYGKLDATDDECIAAAKLAGAHDFITRLPDGYGTMLTGDGANLSQGQKQLLSIARVAVANPPVLILDEATSSIDTRTEYLVQKGMDALMEGRTVFVIAHRLSTIQNSDAIMVLDHGRIIERGSHEELIAKKGQYYQLYTGAFELE
ncbi:MAG TPA: ABC transporter ATP-binding protein [Candidatus Limadaptatus stercorigallinarum]|uniref:ABC transporter ATP-binding protein n=1 Tax=Candidatus Limadaptatus stercorigallinarum TaxID=2840845 RepID=A0A9D1HSY5_9FIRM|nr:ABC transporter ATP-binding protein [Candidatus Limadaptatus stercorigallinarum]